MPARVLQLRMLEDALDYNGDPGIVVLLTGGGAGYLEGAGFHSTLELMYKRRWCIETFRGRILATNGCALGRKSTECLYRWTNSTSPSRSRSPPARGMNSPPNGGRANWTCRDGRWHRRLVDSPETDSRTRHVGHWRDGFLGCEVLGPQRTTAYRPVHKIGANPLLRMTQNRHRQLPCQHRSPPLCLDFDSRAKALAGGFRARRPYT